MDTRILQATTLARIGLDDDQIAQVLRFKERAKVDAPAVNAAPLFASARDQQPQPPLRYDGPNYKRYVPLLDAMRVDVVKAGGVVISTLRGMTAPHDALLRMSAPNPADPSRMRGLASLVGWARSERGGVIGGMKFVVQRANGNKNYTYRVEAV